MKVLTLKRGVPAPRLFQRSVPALRC